MNLHKAARILLFIHYLPTYTYGSATTLSSQDIATLRALGISDSEYGTLQQPPQQQQQSSQTEGGVLLDEYDEYDDDDDSQNVDIEQEEYKSNDDWWKDPFAQFEEDEDEDESNEQRMNSENNMIEDTIENVDNEIMEEEEDSYHSILDDDNNIENLEDELLEEYDPEEEEEDNDEQMILDAEYDYDVYDEEEEDLEGYMPTPQGIAESSEVPAKKIQQKLSNLSFVPKKLYAITKDSSKTSNQSKNRTVSNDNVSTSPSIFPALLLPKAMNFLISSPPVVQLMLSTVVGSYTYNTFRKKKTHSLTPKQEDNTFADNNGVDVINDDDDEANEVQDLGFGRPLPYSRRRSIPQSRRTYNISETPSSPISSTEEETDGRNGDDMDEYNDDVVTPPKESHRPNMIQKLRQERKKLMMQSRSLGSKYNDKPIGLGRRLFNRGKNVDDGQLSSLTMEVNNLQDRLQSVEDERDRLDDSYEKSMGQVQELRRKVDDLTQQNNYLNSQLRDNKRAVERAVNSERQRSNDELARVRDSMVSVLERERRIMRSQIMKTSAEVRKMIESGMNDDDDYDDDELLEDEENNY